MNRTELKALGVGDVVMLAREAAGLDLPIDKTETDRVPTILTGYLAAAKEQLAVLQTMIGNCDGKDTQALAVTALAAENTAATVRKLYQLNLEMRQLYQRNLQRLSNGLA